MRRFLLVYLGAAALTLMLMIAASTVFGQTAAVRRARRQRHESDAGGDRESKRSSQCANGGQLTHCGRGPMRPRRCGWTFPHSHNPLDTYRATNVAPPNLANSSLVDSLIHDGVLEISLKDAISLALENNLDIAIARYNIPIAAADILRTKAGGVFRGVNTGVVQNTPGGGVGGFGSGASSAGGAGAGGTTGGAGGAGSGAGGLVQSTLGTGAPVSEL